jgi:hypothetical protein
MTKMRAQIEIRNARPKDVEIIHHFITQLAIFEKCPEQVKATNETIAKTMGLESEPTEETGISATRLRAGQFAKCVIAYVDNKEAGFAVFFYDYSTVFIISLCMINGSGYLLRGFI